MSQLHRHPFTKALLRPEAIAARVAVDLNKSVLDAARWSYCPGCQTPSYKFPCCGNTSCNGGGCLFCNDSTVRYWEVVERLRTGEVPYHVNACIVPG